MQIAILANNASFIEGNMPLVRQYAVESDIVASIKFKFVDRLLGLPIRRHEIYFRSNPENHVFGLDDHRHLIGSLKAGTRISLINDSPRADEDTANDTRGLAFHPFDRQPIVDHLMSFRTHPVFETIARYALVDGRLDQRRLSTGFTVVLHYALTYPEATIALLGFYERGNRKVLKDGGAIRDTAFHDFDVERTIVEAVTTNTLLIHGGARPPSEGSPSSPTQ